MKTKQLQTGWKEFELKDLGKLIMGQSPKGENYNNEQRGFPLLNGAADFKYKKIMPKQFTIKPTKLSKKGDLVFCIRATIGKTTLSDKEYCLGRGVAGFRVNNKLIERDFLLKILDDKLNRIVLQGSTILGIKAKDIESIKIPLPPLQTQKAIVSILEKAEQLRGKRNQTIEYLDEYLKSVFNEMFLKEKFEEVELGEITKIISGSTPSTQKEEYWNGEINWVTPAELIDGPNYYYYGTQRKITKEGLKSCSAELFPQNTVILTTRAPIGKVAIAGIEMCSNQGFKNFICDKSKLNHVYLYFWFLLNKKQLQSFGHGATFGEVSKSIVSKIKIPLPSLALQQTFASIVEHVEKLKEKQKQSLNEIEQLNGVLMQKAFKGELVR